MRHTVTVLSAEHVRKITDRVAAVTLPLPFRLAGVNAYVLRGDDHVTILDCGLALSWEEDWTTALASLDLTFDDVTRIIVTHFHPDHIGAAGPLAEATGAKVWVSRITAEQTPPVWGPDRQHRFTEIENSLIDNGMPVSRIEELHSEAGMVGSAVMIPDSFEILEINDEIELDGETWEVHATPGHADGHICLYAAQSRRLLSGDHLLENISPAIGLFPGNSHNPLADYFASLTETSRLDIDHVLPGHGEPFVNAFERCQWLIRHHTERAEACVAALGDGWRTAHDVAIAVFGDHHDAANERFAVTESLAHLEFVRAREEGRLEREVDEDGAVRYRAVAGVRAIR